MPNELYPTILKSTPILTLCFASLVHSKFHTVTPELYGEECEFSDPTLSFTGLSTFLENIRNLDPILERFVPPERRRVELKSIELRRKKKSGKGGDGGEGSTEQQQQQQQQQEEEEEEVVVARWRMVGDLKLPWNPRIDLDGRTAFSLDSASDGRIKRYDETWEIPPAAALLQILQPRSAPEIDNNGASR